MDTQFNTKLRRIIKSGFFNFWRSGYVSLASMLVMIVTLSVIGAVIFVGTVLNITLAELRNKVDVNVYFTTTAPEEDILSLKSRIERMPEVLRVEYVSREAALESFKLRHENDEITLQALTELGDNPLGASLNIKAKEPSQYESLSNFLSQEEILASDGSQIIDKVNYFQNKTAIDKLTRIIDSAERMGYGLTIALVIISILITFNTVRLAIYISREEISVMQLVGASRNYVRGQFVITGVIYGLIAGIITVFIFFPLTYWLGSLTQNFFIGFNIFGYYLSNIIQMSFIIIGSGVAIGAASSILAVRKYLKL